MARTAGMYVPLPVHSQVLAVTVPLLSLPTPTLICTVTQACLCHHHSSPFPSCHHTSFTPSPMPLFCSLHLSISSASTIRPCLLSLAHRQCHPPLHILCLLYSWAMWHPPWNLAFHHSSSPCTIV